METIGDSVSPLPIDPRNLCFCSLSALHHGLGLEKGYLELPNCDEISYL